MIRCHPKMSKAGLSTKKKRPTMSVAFGGSGWIREPRTEKQPTGLFFPRPPGRDVLFSSHPLMPQAKTPCRDAAGGFCWWERVDSNHRSNYATDLQSAPIGRSGTLPHVSALNRVLIYYSKGARKMQAFFSFFRHFFLARQRLGGAFKNSSHLRGHSVV